MENSLLGDILQTGKIIYDDNNGIKVYKYKNIYFTVDHRKTLDIEEHRNRKSAIMCAKLEKDWCPR